MALRQTLCVSMLVAASPAPAAEDFIEGVYLQSEELCAKAKKETLQSVIDAGNIVLSAHGLQSVEYNCEFLQVTKATLSPSWAVDRHLPGAGLYLSGCPFGHADEPDSDRPGFGPPGRRRKRAGRQWRQLRAVRRRGSALSPKSQLPA